jgi:hypothetical protein
MIIHSLNARDNVIFDSIVPHFGLNTASIFVAIRDVYLSTMDLLIKSGVDYGRLKNVLVPQSKKNEAMFLFDSSTISNHAYGYEIMSNLMPVALNVCSNNAYFLGDLIAPNSTNVQYRIKK